MKFKLQQQQKIFGPVVQLVRIHACHAWGREFESRPDRQIIKLSTMRAFFVSFDDALRLYHLFSCF